jgi:hypothetical protein
VHSLGEVTASLRWLGAPPAPAADRHSPLGGLVWRPALYRRNQVSWCSVRSWRADAKRADLARLKACKAALDADLIAAAAGELAELIGLLLGRLGGWVVTSIACGHSRRPDCFAKRLGAAVAARLDLRFAEVFADRFVSGVSHPKEFAKLPALAWQCQPEQPVLVIDDIATSGWHIEEALGRIRGRGLAAVGAVWLAGTVK